MDISRRRVAVGGVHRCRGQPDRRARLLFGLGNPLLRRRELRGSRAGDVVADRGGGRADGDTVAPPNASTLKLDYADSGQHDSRKDYWAEPNTTA